MKILFFILICSAAVFAVDCSQDPFATGCQASNSELVDTASDILCSNGYKIKSNGDVVDQSGTVLSNIGAITKASQSQRACKNYGGVTAIGKQNTTLQVNNNNNNANSSAYFAGNAASAGANAVGAAQSAGSVNINSVGNGGIINADPYITNIPSGPPCNDTCECPGSMDVCSNSVCLTITTSHSMCQGGGVLVKGDSSCQWLCSGGSLSCPASGQVCGGGGRGGTTTTSGGTTGGGPTCEPNGTTCTSNNSCVPSIPSCSDCCSPPTGSMTCSGGGTNAVEGTCGGSWHSTDPCMACE